MSTNSGSSDHIDLPQMGPHTHSYGKPTATAAQRPGVYIPSDCSSTSDSGRPCSGEIAGHEQPEAQLLHWRRNSWQNGSPGTGHEVYLPEPHASTDIDYDTKTADDYQSIGELNVNSRYEDVDGFEKDVNPSVKLQSHSYKFCVILTFLITILALLVGAGGLGVGLYRWLIEPESATVMDLQNQLMESRATINELSASVAELRSALYPNDSSTDKNSIETLLDQVDAFSIALEDIVPSLNDLYTNCTTQRSVCNVRTDTFSTEPPFSACTTSGIPFTAEGFQNINVHCAITDSRNEKNPMVATLNIDENDNKVSCFCYVIDLGRERDVIQCSLIAERCPL